MTEEKKETLSEQDFHSLEMANMKKALAQSQMENVSLYYDNILLQISVKYSLTDQDRINEKGEILRVAGENK